MCLLVVLSRVVPGAPLIVGANRDERFDRPAEAMTVLRSAAPRTLGGRDLKAGGTWLAVNEAGVVAGLTNRPVPGGPDAARRSRGELPLALTAHRSAAEAVEAFARSFRPGDYNGAWLLVGDRESLFSVELAGAGEVVVQELAPGLHVQENRSMSAPSKKADHVRALLAGIESMDEGAALRRLRAVLADHEVPPPEPAAEDAGTGAAPGGGGAGVDGGRDAGGRGRDGSGAVPVPGAAVVDGPGAGGAGPAGGVVGAAGSAAGAAAASRATSMATGPTVVGADRVSTAGSAGTTVAADPATATVARPGVDELVGPGGEEGTAGAAGAEGGDGEAPKPPPPEIRAACVHTPEFGTRWSGLVVVAGDPSVPPAVTFTDGPSCTSPPVDATSRWR
jgi:uncharacterized protein with NRDE domain